MSYVPDYRAGLVGVGRLGSKRREVIRVAPVVARTADVLGAWPGDPLAPLSDAERERAAALVRDHDRDDYVASHLLVRQAAAARLRVPPPAVQLQQKCRECGGPHGRPEVLGVDDLWLSLSRTHGWVAAVAADRPCGIDVELISGPPTGAVVEQVLTAEEQRWMITLPEAELPSAFAGLWVRKEAVVKTGAARLDDIGGLAVQGASPVLVAGCDVRDLDVPVGAGVAAAVAVARQHHE
jgi:4'-phosphopantetheinyl transferase